MAADGADLAFAPIEELAPRLHTREVSPIELADLTLRRIEAINPRINAYYTVLADELHTDAERAEREIARGQYRGPLHGVPICIKDIYESGRTTCGSQTLQHYKAANESVAVRKLRNAGALIAGKAATFEFAYGMPSRQSPVAPVRNPWNEERQAGGSSSGSAAAVAAGLAYAGMGSCTGGSIRWPAQCCHLVGLKPTYGRVSRRGIYPLAWSLDHAGPITRTVRDAALMLQGCAGFDEGDPAAARVPVPDFTAKLEREIRGMKIGLPVRLYEDCQPVVREVFEEALRVFERLGAELVTVPSISAEEMDWIEYPALWSDAATIHFRQLRARSGDYNPNTRQYLQWGLLVSSGYYLTAQRCRAQVRDDLIELLTKQVDVLVLPTNGFQSPPLIPEQSPGLSFLSGFHLYTAIFNFTGLPAVQVPCGVDRDGLPVGLQVAAKPFDEPTLLQVAHAYEQATEWHHRHADL